MTTTDSPALGVAQRIAQLADTRQKVLAMPADKALATIVKHAQPAALVHSMTEEDLHFLIHDIGVEDALPLLALASNRQWEYLLDSEVWHRDRLDAHQFTHWLQLLLRADADRLVRWCYEEKLELLELYLFGNIEVRIRESDQAPSDLGDGFFSDDDTYYVRILDYPAGTPEEEAVKKLRNEMISQLLRRLSIYDHPRYQGLLLESTALIPSEVEEELFRLRNVRLAEKGFLPFDEAIGVYQPLRPGDLEARGQKVLRTAHQTESVLPVPQFTSAFLEGDNLFVRAIKTIQEPAILQQLQVELAGLCNRVLAADQMIVRSREQLAGVVAKVSGYLSIGLETISAQTDGHTEAVAADSIRRHLLGDIFRSGFAVALELKWRAESWRRKSWCQARRVDLTFWGEAWLGLLGGLLIERPQFYDPGHGASNYREFQTLAEVAICGRALDEVTALDALFDNLEIPVQGSLQQPRNYKNLLLTLWARNGLQLPPLTAEEPDPSIELKRFVPFFDQLWTPAKEGNRIGDERRNDFLQWVAQVAQMDTVDLSERLGWVFESLFDELEAELGAVSAANLDVRHIHLFLLRA